jgi:integrase
VAHWRDLDGVQHKRVLGLVWVDRGQPRDGHLTKRGARGALDEILTEERRRLPGSALRARAPVTFEEASSEWLRYIREDRARRSSTVLDYERVLRNVLLPVFGAVPIDALTARDIDRFRAALVAERRLSGRTINKYLAQLHSIFRRAQRIYGLAGNPAAGAERQPVSRSGDFDVLSVEEIGKLVAAAGSELDAAIFVTAAFAGLRLGELRAIRWSDLAFAKRLVHVRRSFVMGEAGPPKSGRVRSVPMVDDVADALKELRRRDRFTEDDDFVFAGPLGAPFEDSALRRRFYAALERAELTRVRFHDLRHSFGTLAVQVFPLSDVKTFMGHADIATTMIYVHHVPQHDAATRLGAVLHRERAMRRPESAEA